MLVPPLSGGKWLVPGCMGRTDCSLTRAWLHRPDSPEGWHHPLSRHPELGPQELGVAAAASSEFLPAWALDWPLRPPACK